MEVQENVSIDAPRAATRLSAAFSALSAQHLLSSRADSGCSNTFGELSKSGRISTNNASLRIVSNRPGTEDDDGLSVFLHMRKRLLGIAYRILKSAAEAEDLVQDVWIRWQMADRNTVRDAAALLITMTTRLAINVVTSARSRRETAFGSTPQGSVDPCPDPGVEAERSEGIQSAVFVLLQRLSPAERAAYVLREAFDYSYHQIAKILRLEAANARQLVTRARQHLSQGQCSCVSSAEQRNFLAAFLAAAQGGAFATLESFLAGGATGTASRNKRRLRSRSTLTKPVTVYRRDPWRTARRLDARVA